MKGALALIGFMGAGKTTVGRLVAERLGAPFIDTDDRIVEAHGAIEDIFAQHGEKYFRGIEGEIVCAELLEPFELAKVVALGGGAVTNADVREALSRLAHVVWLDAPVGVLWGRAGRGRRPLAGDYDSFVALYESRRPLYESAATAVVTNGRDDEAGAVCVTVLDVVGRC